MAIQAKKRPGNCYLGCAGWSVPALKAPGAHEADGVPGESPRDAPQTVFAGEGSQLQRYAAVLPAVEINSSFYRPHRPATYARWKDSVPDDFRFSVKLPKQITHLQRLREADEALDKFLFEASHLGHKFGCLLVQLPPSLAFDAAVVETFFSALRQRFEGAVVCEPRHATWISGDAAALLRQFSNGYVDADPSPFRGKARQVAAATATTETQDAAPGKTLPAMPDTGADVLYSRLHGSPVIYRSSYAESTLALLAASLSRRMRSGQDVWCIFDNTAEGAALHNVLRLRQLIGSERQ